MTHYLTLPEVLNLAERLGTSEVRDFGLLDSALARPQSSVFGQDAYPDIWEKAAALMESLARNHGLVDGNKRIAWYATWVFLHMNGHPLDMRLRCRRGRELRAGRVPGLAGRTQDRRAATAVRSLTRRCDAHRTRRGHGPVPPRGAGPCR